MLLKRSYIKGIFSPTYYQRGLKYFRSGKVQSVKVQINQEDLLVFEALVKGRGSTPYHCDIKFSSQHIGSRQRLHVEGLCSCPVSYNCKHIVAACLHFEEQTSRSGPSHLNWLDKLGSAEPDQIPDSENKLPLLLFFLKQGYEVGVLELKVMQSYQKKRGGLAKARSFSISNIYHDDHYNRFTESQQTILRLIKSLTPYFGDVCKIRGELGGILLKHLVCHGYCYWEHLDDQPFSLGPDLPMNLIWEDRPDGQKQLTPVLDIPGSKVLLTDPAYYIAVDQRVIGIIENTGFSQNQLATLIKGPVVEEESLLNVSKKLALDYPKLAIPKPVQVDIERVENEAPHPRLILSKTVEDGYAFHVLDLQFRYGDVLVDLFPEESITSLTLSRKVIQIHRDRDEESLAKYRLLEYGFVPFTTRTGKTLFYGPADSFLESINRWYHFVEEEVDKLVQSGWELVFDDSFSLSFLPADDYYAECEESDNNWFELSFDLKVNGQNIPMVPLIEELLNSYPMDALPESIAMPISDTENVIVQKNQIEPIIQTLQELFEWESRESFRVNRFDAGRLAALDQQNPSLQIKGAQRLLELGRKLLDFKGIQDAQLPRGLEGELRDYQKTGVNWLQFLREFDFNGILADDMGLGKTVQILTHLLIEKEAGRLDQPCLIIAPTSLMSNWRREAERFTPALRVLTLQGVQRKQHFDHIYEYDIILSTYPLLFRDREHLIQHQWSFVILDEAQMVKNPKAQSSRVIRELQTKHKICLTGTPMENHLGELWALYDFLMPGFLADAKTFTSMFRTPIEKHGNISAGHRLAQRVRPFLLRRGKMDVLDELPEKTNITRSVQLGEQQARLYESIRLSMERKVRDAIAEKGLSRSHITILDALLKLRQVCCDPHLVKVKQARSVKHSAKLDLLMIMLPELLEEGHKVLIFSQFTSMLTLIEPALESHRIKYSKLTGQSRNREAIIDEFKSGKTDVFLISLKAGGLGLNLTEADSVVIYDPWWNPAVEQQAADRVHRIGQEKPVFVYKLIVENSVEEKILALQEKKQALAQSIYRHGGEKAQIGFTSEDIQELFAPLTGPS